VKYSFEYNDNEASLVQSESVGFTIAGLNPNCFTSYTCVQNSTFLSATTYAIRLTRNPSGNNTANAWASGASIDPLSAVPEAETTAIF